MQQGYWYVSDASQKAQTKFISKAKKYSGVNAEETSMVMFSSAKQSVEFGGKAFRTGQFAGRVANTMLVEHTKVVGLLLGLNHTLYDPAFDNVMYMTDTRNPFTVLGVRVSARRDYLTELSRAKRVHEFVWEEGKEQGCGWSETNEKNDISALTMTANDLSVTLEVSSDEGNSSNTRRVSKRMIRLNPNGEVRFYGNKSLSHFDMFMAAALISGWATKRINL